MRVARVQITAQFLCELLSLPFATEVLGSRECVGMVEILVTHPELPDAPEGAMPMANPRFRKQPEIVFEGWGI